MALAMAMLGIFFLLKYEKHDHKLRRSFLYPFLAALSFGAAEASREPYTIFVIGGIATIAIIQTRVRGELADEPRSKRVVYVFLPILLFAVPGIILLYYPQNFANFAFPTGESYFQEFANFISPPSHGITTVSISTTVTTSSGGNSSTTSSITTTPSTASLTTTSNTSSSVTVSTGQTVSAQIGPQVRFIDTVTLFLRGLVLGWSPLLFGVAMFGLLPMIRLMMRKQTTISVPAFSLLALGSFFFVSYYFSNQAVYLTSSTYSTIIRYSHSALPAYFLLAPLTFSLLARKGRYLLAVALILFVVTVGAVPLYETYATSNLGISSNVFSLDYRAPGVAIRDYVLQHPNEVFNIMAPLANFWFFAPGSDNLPSVHFFTYLNQSDFVNRHWETFYVYGYDLSLIKQQAPYLLPLMIGESGNSASSLSYFHLVNRQIVFQNLNGPDFFIKFQISWSNA